VPVRKIVIHHTATSPTTTLEAIARYHINPDPSRNKDAYPGIAYHVVIEADGRASLTNYFETMSYHVGSENHYCVGVSFVGDFTKVPSTAAQIAAGRVVLQWLYEELGLGPDAVLGHKDLPNQETACPGNLPQNDWWRVMLTMFDEQKIRNAAFNSAGIPLNPDSAFYKEAGKRQLGKPETGEVDLDGYRFQGFDGGILVARLFIENGVVMGGDWEHMELVPWLPPA